MGQAAVLLFELDATFLCNRDRCVNTCSIEAAVMPLAQQGFRFIDGRLALLLYLKEKVLA